MGVMYTWFHVYRPMGPDANPRAVPDARAAAAGAPVRRRDAGEEADHHRRRLFRRRGPGAVPGGDRHQPSHQSLGRHRAVPDRAVHEGVDPRQRGRPPLAARQVPAVGVPARLPRRWPSRRRAAASCWSGRTCSRQLVEKHGAATRRSAARPWRNWRRWRCGRRSTIRATRSRRRTGCIAWRSATGSTISASIADTTTAGRRRRPCCYRRQRVRSLRSLAHRGERASWMSCFACPICLTCIPICYRRA